MALFWHLLLQIGKLSKYRYWINQNYNIFNLEWLPRTWYNPADILKYLQFYGERILGNKTARGHQSNIQNKKFKQNEEKKEKVNVCCD